MILKIGIIVILDKLYLRQSFRTFNGFADSFRSRFSDADFQFELRQEIYRRTEGERERAADYFTCMISLFDRVIPRFTIQEKISFIHRNILPRYQLVIPRETIFSLAHFQKIAVSIEKIYLVSKSFRPPPLPERSLLPDLAYKDPSRFKSKENKESILLLNETEEVDNDCSNVL